jgi:hypothetical protein
MQHLPRHAREKETWRHVAAQLADAARGGDVTDAFVALRIVPQLEGVACRHREGPRRRLRLFRARAGAEIGGEVTFRVCAGSILI